MKAEILAFEKKLVQVEVAKEGSKKPVIEARPVAIITLRSELPDILPVGKLVDLRAIKEETE